jgi:hypothetical protein
MITGKRTMTSGKWASVLTTLRMASRPLKEMPMSELLRVAKTPKGRTFLLEEVETMEGLIKQVRAALGEPPPQSEPAWQPDSRQIKRRRARKFASSPKPEQHLGFDGSLASLAECYRTHVDSAYQKVRHVTRVSYDGLINRLVDDHGPKKLADLKLRDVEDFHARWSAGGKTAMGHSLVGMLRALIHFGATVLDDADCVRLSVALHTKKFKLAKPRSERLTEDHVFAIINKAREAGRKSIALAQALQFQAQLRQKDTIGEYVPLSEPGISAIVFDNMKWLRGVTWDEIDENWILRHPPSRGGDLIEVQLSPLVRELLGPRGIGPVVISETSGQPYSALEYRRAWRKIATAAGVPKHIKNMDSRSNAKDFKDADDDESEADTVTTV